MKKFLLILAVLCQATSAFAGPNAGGTLVVHDKALLAAATIGTIPICPQGNLLTVCTSADVRIDGANDPASAAFFEVYAAFCGDTSPRLMGITWGIHYSGISLAAGWNCADGQLPDNDAWPSSDDGDTVWWNTVQLGHLVPFYVFAAYGYGPAASFDLRTDPAQAAGQFGDDSVPAILDDIAGYSKMGFDGPGLLVCPTCAVPLGACCDPANGTCTFIAQAECATNWQGGTCDPNPCPPPEMGACCDAATGGCTFVFQSDCSLVWHGGPCAPNPCPQPTGACCVGLTCSLQTQAHCGPVDAWLGAGTSCTPNPCPHLGACCLCVQNTCQTVSQAVCLAMGGIYFYDGSNCRGWVCSLDDIGACCVDGVCMFGTAENCSPGTFAGYCTTCSPNPCQPQVPTKITSWGRIKATYRKTALGAR